MVIHVFMWLLEGYPFFYILIGLISHFLYYQLLRRFPHIELTNLLFILSCGTYHNIHYMNQAQTIIV